MATATAIAADGSDDGGFDGLGGGGGVEPLLASDEEVQRNGGYALFSDLG